MSSDEASFAGVVQEGESLYLLVYAPGADKPHLLRLSLDDQSRILTAITDRLVGKALLLARDKAGAPISSKDAP